MKINYCSLYFGCKISIVWYVLADFNQRTNSNGEKVKKMTKEGAGDIRPCKKNHNDNRILTYSLGLVISVSST